MTLTLFKIKRITRLGSRSLLDHKLRSFLTALGIIFGVGSVIAMLAIGEGASFEAREQIRRLGSNNIIVNAVKPAEKATGSSAETKRMSIYGLTYEDARRIQVLFPDVRVMVPARVVPARLRVGDIRLPGRAVGTVPWFLTGTTMRLRSGRFLTDADVQTAANVCVLGPAVAKAL
jgi:putative ABC transport system permease protein